MIVIKRVSGVHRTLRPDRCVALRDEPKHKHPGRDSDLPQDQKWDAPVFISTRECGISQVPKNNPNGSKKRRIESIQGLTKAIGIVPLMSQVTHI
jgi:hypothetical protein